MFKRIIAITARDLKSGFRDFIVVYMIITPFLLAFVLSLFVPSAGAATVRFAVDENLGNEVTDYLSRVGHVEIMEEGKSIQDRVLQNDDIVGITMKGSQFEIILEGNESEGTEEIARPILMHYENGERNLPLEVRFDDVGWKVSPLAQYGSITLVIMTTVLGGMLISFNIVEEKQSGTISAVNVSPVGRMEFIAGKSLPGFVFPIVQSVGVMLIFGFTGLNLAMLIPVVFCSALVGIILGFVIGIIANDQISAISSMKMTFMPVAVSILGAILLPSEWLPVLYWSPFYWTFEAVNNLILKQAAWSNIVLNCGAILALALIVFLFLKKKIQRGLA